MPKKTDVKEFSSDSAAIQWYEEEREIQSDEICDCPPVLAYYIDGLERIDQEEKVTRLK